MKIQVVVFWVVTPCNDGGRIPKFQRTLLPPSSVQPDPPKCWYPTTSLHSVTMQKT
jgi:hypothetical protein